VEMEDQLHLVEDHLGDPVELRVGLVDLVGVVIALVVEVLVDQLEDPHPHLKVDPFQHLVPVKEIQEDQMVKLLKGGHLELVADHLESKGHLFHQIKADHDSEDIKDHLLEVGIKDQLTDLGLEEVIPKLSAPEVGEEEQVSQEVEEAMQVLIETNQEEEKFHLLLEELTRVTPDPVVDSKVLVETEILEEVSLLSVNKPLLVLEVVAGHLERLVDQVEVKM